LAIVVASSGIIFNHEVSVELMYSKELVATTIPAFNIHPFSTAPSLRSTSGFLSSLSIPVKLMFLQVILIILSSESNVTQLEGAEEDGCSSVSDEPMEAVAIIELIGLPSIINIIRNGVHVNV
jgi:hypothetical protein